MECNHDSVGETARDLVTTTSPTSPGARAGRWSPGSLLRARGREWIVLTGGDDQVLRVRPVSGSEEDQTFIHTALEGEPVTDASFPLPDPRQKSGHDGALLLRDALVLSLRRGAGPFRSFGQIAIEPRAYQLVPLLMALKLDPVRLLIADDVGVGKTIEAALIARELIDRGDITRFTVLCPPHLVDQWVNELERRFHLHPEAVTAASAARLEHDAEAVLDLGGEGEELQRVAAQVLDQSRAGSDRATHAEVLARHRRDRGEDLVAGHRALGRKRPRSPRRAR